MAYGGHPSTDINDAIRLLVGDTDPANPLLSDDELLFFRNTYGDNTYIVGAAIADVLANRFAGYVDQTVGRVSVSYSQKARQYQELAARLRLQTARGTKPYCGGISEADIETEEDDADRPLPIFDVGRDDYQLTKTELDDK